MAPQHWSGPDHGRELSWLPFPGVAAPMTYQLSPEGRQYVIIAAGG